MRLKILLPFQVFLDVDHVTRLVVEDRGGSFGILPHRLDCVAALSTGLLTFETSEGEVFVAMDQGLLVKTGPEVLVTLRQARSGADPGLLREAIERDFQTRNSAERELRTFVAKMESAFLHRMAELHHG